MIFTTPAVQLIMARFAHNPDFGKLSRKEGKCSFKNSPALFFHRVVARRRSDASSKAARIARTPLQRAVWRHRKQHGSFTHSPSKVNLGGKKTNPILSRRFSSSIFSFRSSSKQDERTSKAKCWWFSVFLYFFDSRRLCCRFNPRIRPATHAMATTRLT